MPEIGSRAAEFLILAAWHWGRPASASSSRRSIRKPSAYQHVAGILRHFDGFPAPHMVSQWYRSHRCLHDFATFLWALQFRKFRLSRVSWYFTLWERYACLKRNDSDSISLLLRSGRPHQAMKSHILEEYISIQLRNVSFWFILVFGFFIFKVSQFHFQSHFSIMRYFHFLFYIYHTAFLEITSARTVSSRLRALPLLLPLFWFSFIRWKFQPSGYFPITIDLRDFHQFFWALFRWCVMILILLSDYTASGDSPLIWKNTMLTMANRFPYPRLKIKAI